MSKKSCAAAKSSEGAVLRMKKGVEVAYPHYHVHDCLQARHILQTPHLLPEPLQVLCLCRKLQPCLQYFRILLGADTLF